MVWARVTLAHRLDLADCGLGPARVGLEVDMQGGQAGVRGFGGLASRSDGTLVLANLRLDRGLERIDLVDALVDPARILRRLDHQRIDPGLRLKNAS